jgi:SGNH domain-containing protein
MNVSVVLIGRTPVFPFSVPSCLARRPETACRMSRTQFDEQSADINRMLAQVAAAHHYSHLWLPTDQFCDARWCYPGHPGIPSFTDDGHISRPASERALPAMKPFLDMLVSRP